MNSYIDILNKGAGIASLLLTGFGTVSNLMTFCLCMRKRLRKTPTFIFIAFSSITEIIPLYFRNLEIFVYPFFGVYLKYLYPVICVINSILHCFPLESAAWFLVVTAFERYLSIKVTKFRRKFKSKHAVILSIVIIAVFFAVNLPLSITAKFEERKIKVGKNFTQTITFCNEFNPIAAFYVTLTGYLYSLVPFGALFVANTLLAYELVIKKDRIKRSSKDKAKRTNITVSVAALTVSYIILTGPMAITSGFYFNEISSLPYGWPIFNWLSVLRFLNHSFGFVILMITNKKISSEFKSLFNKRSVEYSTNNTNRT